VKYLDEYRNLPHVPEYTEALKRSCSREWTIMEVCGGQTHSILRFGLDELLSHRITLLHGPGCPVCVTSLELIDLACRIAARKDTILCSFGDMMRVPGSEESLLAVKARGGDVRIVYSPMDALLLAEQLPQRKVVFFAVGFETTAPANAMAVFQARRKGVSNFSMLSAHVRVPPALRAILSSDDCRVNGFLAAGHVCAVMGYTEYEPIAAEFGVPIVVTGFEPVDLLQGILHCVRQLEKGQAVVENQYPRAVGREGNLEAQKIMKQVFLVADRSWRGIGIIPESGLNLRPEYSEYDASKIFGLEEVRPAGNTFCLSGQVLQGYIKPDQCPYFSTRCTPENPMGATMVSSEGACAAYYRYRPQSAGVTYGSQQES